MKVKTGFLLGAMTGMGILALYNKYGSDMMCDMKQTVKKMSKDASKNIENMM